MTRLLLQMQFPCLYIYHYKPGEWDVKKPASNAPKAIVIKISSSILCFTEDQQCNKGKQSIKKQDLKAKLISEKQFCGISVDNKTYDRRQYGNKRDCPVISPPVFN